MSRTTGFGRSRASEIFRDSLDRELRKFQGVSSLTDELEYAKRFHRSTERRPLDFDAFPFLVDLYLDPCRYIVVIKAVQVGVSERAIVRALSRAEKGLSVMYVLQSQVVRNRFVSARVDRLFDFTPHYREKQRASIGSVDARMMKNFGLGLIVFVGSNAPDEFTSLPMDSLIIDELDRCNQDNLLLAPDRLERSSLHEEMRISRPSLKKFGIDREYGTTDRKVWMIRCGACGERQALDWFRQVVTQVDDNRFDFRDTKWKGKKDEGEELRLMCRKCGKAMDRLSRGTWVAEYPDVKDRSGYEISQLFTPVAVEGGRHLATMGTEFVSALDNASEMARFYNSKLGKAYTAPGASITETDLLAASDPEWMMPFEGNAVTMGVDVGKLFHIRVSDEPRPGLRRALYVGTVTSIEEVEAVMLRYNVSVVVVDIQPETHLVKKLRDGYPGRVWLCRFKRLGGREMEVNEEEGVVQVDRTEWHDRSQEDIRKGVNVLPRDVVSLDGGEYVRQMTASTRKLVTTPTGEPRYIWDEGTEPDHHRLADLYDVVAGEMFRSGFGGGLGYAMG